MTAGFFLDMMNKMDMIFFKQRAQRTQSFLEKTYGMSAGVAGHIGMFMSILLDMINMMDMMPTDAGMY